MLTVFVNVHFFKVELSSCLAILQFCRFVVLVFADYVFVISNSCDILLDLYYQVLFWIEALARNQA